MVGFPGILGFLEGAPCKGADGWGGHAVRQRRGARPGAAVNNHTLWLGGGSNKSRAPRAFRGALPHFLSLFLIDSVEDLSNLAGCVAEWIRFSCRIDTCV
jgi:hypothetical protein